MGEFSTYPNIDEGMGIESSQGNLRMQLALLLSWLSIVKWKVKVAETITLPADMLCNAMQGNHATNKQTKATIKHTTQFKFPENITIYMDHCTLPLRIALQKLQCNNCTAKIALQKWYCTTFTATISLHTALHNVLHICNTNKGNNTCRSIPMSPNVLISSDRSSCTDDGLLYIHLYIRPLFQILSIYAFLYC